MASNDASQGVPGLRRGLAPRTLGGLAVLALLALLVVLAVALGPGPAAAMPVVVGDDATGCLDPDRESVEGGSLIDELNTEVTGPDTGNARVRHDRFDLDDDVCSSVFISGVSVLVKTPLEIEGSPVTDIDSIPDASSASALFAHLAGQPIWEDFHPDFGASFTNECAIFDPGSQTCTQFGAPADGAFMETFHSVQICINAGDIASCLAGTPIVLTNIGGGFMIYSIDLGEGGFELFVEGDESFEITTILRSTAFGEVPGNDIPEAAVAWRFATLVPEPSLAALLLGTAALLALRRRV